MIQETTKALNVVQEMLTAFGKGDMDALQKTLSDDTIWISSGGGVAVALRLSQQLENAVIVSVICDRGERYLSTGVFPA